MYDLVIKNVRIDQLKIKDIAMKDGCICKIGSISEPANKVVDGEKRWLLPPYVESHVHLDTALISGKPFVNQSGELFEGINIWNKYKENFLTHEDVMERAKTVIKMMAGQGVLFMRCMVDISDPQLTALKALLEVKRSVAHFMTVQLVGFPQNGLLSSKDGFLQLEQAIDLGVDGISAVPHLEATREKGVTSLEQCFQLAVKHKKFLHIFCDEIDDSQSRFLEVVASLAIETGLHEQVTASHVNAMSYYDEAYVRKLLDLLKASRINIVTAPLINSAMQGRVDASPKGRGITRVKELHEAGINVAVAHDDILSPFYPLGTGSMLAAGHMLLHLAHMTGEKDFKTVLQMMTSNAAKVLGIKRYEINEGNQANFILVSAANAQDLLRRQPVAELVVANGQILAETPKQETKWNGFLEMPRHL
ncbi:amidohydrolase family protein [Halalkalibacter kiskunsagensis]|uniref:Amidohydrolase family protein n=1 Tax=Halalkalibacter kiskunsagensis TaxID=1548599 RepID=A0ABV6K9A8_9BACI